MKKLRFSFVLLSALSALTVFLLVHRQSLCKESQTVADGKHPNRLIHEKSPYLLQHAYNPVDWYPWGDEAFEKARKENKPIFLSIGYSTCHWCHVMEKESYNDPEVAKLMNETFISIKVDREERPDIDNFYMGVALRMNGSGGWPLNVVMTPDKKPFFAGTYFPKESRFGQTGLMELIPKIGTLWRTKHEEILKSANEITGLAEALPVTQGKDLDSQTLHEAYLELSREYDEKNGGFGSAPKFPAPHRLTFLLRYRKRAGNNKALERVEKTLQAMRRGGVYDQIGFGFHRYSTDSHWHIPHFEKMLYDQALLAIAYLEAFQATGKKEYAETAREIFEYVARDMRSRDGGFFSAQDADSEGEEGKFYLWTREEIEKILGKNETRFFLKTYSLENNILSLKNIPSEELRSRLEPDRQKLFAVREKRVHPATDDKILTDWNGLMIASLSFGAQVLGEPKYANLAEEAAGFISKNLKAKGGGLLHRYRDGQAVIMGNLDDYSFLIWGLLNLYESTFHVEYLKEALQFNSYLHQHFWDEKNGGFYFSSDQNRDLAVRQKEIYDGAAPSGNSIAMLNLLRLSRITANPAFDEEAATIGRAFSGKILDSPSEYCQFLNAVDFGLGPSYEVVIAGKPESADTLKMIDALRKEFLPNKVVLLRPTDAKFPDITRIADFTKYQTAKDGKATAYVCLHYACKKPTTDSAEMLRLLGEKP